MGDADDMTPTPLQYDRRCFDLIIPLHVVACLLYVRCCFVDAVDMCMYYGMFMVCFAYTKKVKVPLALIDDVVFTICLVECCLVEWHVVVSEKGWHE